MKERPILFSGPMVKALLDGSKTQTRRLCKLAPRQDKATSPRCPFGSAGERLWVRETWAHTGDRIVYRADGERDGQRWKPGIHMLRADSRIDLEIVEVRVQRLQDITEEDARAEGVTIEHGTFRGVKWLARRPDDIHAHAFARLWDTINGERAPWASNPWVWALTFKRVRP